jgi:N-acetylneuraminic acid mutarotase
MHRFTGSNEVSDILQYNITSDTIEKVSSLSYPTYGGYAVKGKDSQSIYYFGGWNTKTAIHRFNPATKATVKLSTVLPSDVYNQAGMTSQQSAMIFNGRNGSILEFNVASETVKKSEISYLEMALLLLQRVSLTVPLTEFGCSLDPRTN